MNIEKLVENYSPSPQVVDLLANTNIVLLCGISGAGKNTIENELLKDGLHFSRIITSTTRAPRENNGQFEQDGKDYYFLTHEQAAEMIKNREYFEVAHVHDNIYGVTAAEIQRIHDAGLSALGDVDYQGVEYFHSRVPSVTVIFIMPPSFDVWIERMRSRYDTEEDFQEVFPVRKQSAIRELEWALGTEFCHFVVNDDLDAAVDDTRALIDGNMPLESEGRELARKMLEQMKLS